MVESGLHGGTGEVIERMEQPAGDGETKPDDPTTSETIKLPEPAVSPESVRAHLEAVWHKGAAAVRFARSKLHQMVRTAERRTVDNRPHEPRVEPKREAVTAPPTAPAPTPDHAPPRTADRRSMDPPRAERDRSSVESGMSSVGPTENAMTAPTVRPTVTTPFPEDQNRIDRPSERVRTVYARQGDDIEISFKENGWLLLEMPDGESGLRFISRTAEGERTLFKFNGRKMGEYALPFQYQDHLRGIMRREIIQIKVVPEDEFDSLIGSRNTESESLRLARDREEAARLYELGKYQEALRTYLAAYSEGDPSLNETIATLALLQKDFRNAALYWKKNLTAPGAFRDKAVIGLVKTFTAADQKRELELILKELYTVKNFPIEDELVLLIRYFTAKNDGSLVEELLGRYLDLYPDGRYLDEIYFRLGELYEYSSAIRDFKKARGYYTFVVRDYPESGFYGAARERIDYINRHYFHVR